VKNFKVWQQRPPLLVVVGSERKARTQYGLPFEQDNYKANLKLLGIVQADNAHEALVRAKEAYPWVKHPMAE